MIGKQAARSLQLISGVRACGPAPEAEQAELWPGVVARIAVDLDEAGHEDASEVVAGILAEMWERLVPPMTPAEEYELACTRMDQAAARLLTVRHAGERQFAAAEAESEAARAAVRAMESRPGVPLPQYDPLRGQ
jgi:hypothetical protein